MSQIARAAARAEVAERRHLTETRRRIAATERAIRQIMAAAPLGSPPEAAKQLAEQLHVLRTTEHMALRDWESSRRVARLARATG